jgi:hypothetical protein
MAKERIVPFVQKKTIFLYVSYYIFLEGEFSDWNVLRWAEINVEYVQWTFEKHVTF